MFVGLLVFTIFILSGLLTNRSISGRLHLTA
jgi:hypothetical protein